MIRNTGLLIKMESIERQRLERIGEKARKQGLNVWVDIEQNLIAISGIKSCNGLVQGLNGSELFETNTPLLLAMERFRSKPNNFVEIWEILGSSK